MTTAMNRVMQEWAKVNEVAYKSLSELRRLYYNRWIDHPRCCVEFRRKGETQVHRHTFRTTDEAEKFILDNGLQVLAEKVGDNYTFESFQAAAKKVNVDYFYVQMKEGK